MSSVAEHSIDSHPMKSRIIEAVAKGQSARKIAAWCDPPLHFATVARFARRVKEVGAQQLAVAKILRANDNISGDNTVRPEDREILDATKQAMQANPVLARISQKFGRYDRWLQGAESNEDYRACASVDGAETKALELQAKLLGLLQDTAGTTNNVQILVLPPSTRPESLQSAQGQIGAGEVIDVEPG
jgi:hypothetical protein